MFSSNKRVYTSESDAATAAENVGVEGKRYPTNAFGRSISKHPCLFFISVILPFAFFIIGCICLCVNLDYTLASFQLRKSVPVRASADKYNSVMNAWTATLSGEAEFGKYIETPKERTRIRDVLELRTSVNLKKVYDYCMEYNVDYDSVKDTYSDLMNTSNFINVAQLELFAMDRAGYENVCFTNDFEYGTASNAFPTCAPISSVSQYVYPQYDMPTGKWHMDGSGKIEQVNILPRVFANPNYRWFFDSNFSTVNPHARQMRAQITLASTPGQLEDDYKAKRKLYILDAVKFFTYQVGHPFIEITLGGDVVEFVKIEEAVDRDQYKVGLAFLIPVLLGWWHCGTFTMGLYTGSQVIMTYFATCGLYYLIYKELPLLTYSSVIWVMTFGMHGTLSFYDMFIFSGIMATKGRRNNLSVPQRLCFTIRRISVGVWLSSILAIVIFAVNTTSAFNSVIQFGIFMIIASLWNMYFIVLPTPAFVTIHHFHFSNKRRNLQKQHDVLNSALHECRRASASARVLTAIQDNLSPGERAYAIDEGVIMARIGANRGINKRRYRGVKDFMHQQLTGGFDKLLTARQDTMGAAHKARKTKGTILREGTTMPQELPAFCIDDFLDIGPANPLGPDEGEGGPGLRRPMYTNPRLVPPSSLIHVDHTYTERGEVCWAAINEAIDQRAGPEGLSAPHVFSLKTVGPHADDIERFQQRWLDIGETLEIQGGERNELTALLVRSVVRAQDPSFVVGGSPPKDKEHESPQSKPANSQHVENSDRDRPGDDCNRDNGGNDNDDDGNEWRLETDWQGDERGYQQRQQRERVVKPGASSMGISKLRHRWANRHKQRRTRFFGLFGQVEDESQQERIRRVMGRSVKRQGYTIFDRILMNYFIPFIHFARYVLVCIFVALFVILCVFGSRIHPAGLPTTLIESSQDVASRFADMDNVFGQRGTCTFCGPYYKPVEVFRTATHLDINACLRTKYEMQMNIFKDSCGVCNGHDACVDCTGTPNGKHIITQCGSCDLPNSTVCDCSTSHDCSYCEYMLGKEAHSGGHNCSKICDPETCGVNGQCGKYSGECECHTGYALTTCAKCEPWLLEDWFRYNCEAECTQYYDGPQCNCDVLTRRCTGCPPGKAGYMCNVDYPVCGPKGTVDSETNTCACDDGWGGDRCTVATKCNGRGDWLEASESPTGEAMCACKGHWHGATCQLCDCLNGGYCSGSTGQCQCVGAFTGARCQVCVATCSRHGTCPVVDPKLWNTRSCISQLCGKEATVHEEACEACSPDRFSYFSPENKAYCAVLTDKMNCSMRSTCWWNSTSCVPNDGSNSSDMVPLARCECTHPTVWSGPQCDVCLAPDGVHCQDNGQVVGCDGFVRDKMEDATRLDRCGVCGGGGLCRGCDGVPGSNASFDSCGVCGGNGTCVGGDLPPTPLQINYMLNMGNIPDITNSSFAAAIVQFCLDVRALDAVSSTRPCFIEDYLDSKKLLNIVSLSDLYGYAESTGRLGEVGFEFSDGSTAQKWLFMVYPVTSNFNVDDSTNVLFAVYSSLSSLLSEMHTFTLENNFDVTFLLTSTTFQPVVAEVLAMQSLWFSVGIGLAVTFVFLLVYFVSVTTAVAATMATGIICFGTLTVCTFFPSWKLDSVLQVCVSCTIPIGVEYVVHLCSGYFDYLQTTTSHLFAKSVSRRAAVQGAALRSMAAICTSAVSVILCSVMFVVTSLTPSKRSAQVCITMHLILLISVVLFCGSMIALGPMTAYKHWVLSTILCLIFAVGAAIAVGIIYGVGGVLSPTGAKLLGR